MNIQFHFEKRTALNDRKRLKEFITSIFKREHIKANNLEVIFCSDEYLLNINQNYLKHDFYTDIITFDLSQHGDSFLNAEIYISSERVKENAVNFKTSFQNELHRVIFHGVLHLCGYKDKSKQDIEIMRRKENEYLKAYLI